MNRTESARQVVKEIVADLCGRSGLQNEWEQIDSETTKEIKETWVKIVLRNNKEEEGHE